VTLLISVFNKSDSSPDISSSVPLAASSVSFEVDAPAAALSVSLEEVELLE
jgi:hypothetical protein